MKRRVLFATAVAVLLLGPGALVAQETATKPPAKAPPRPPAKTESLDLSKLPAPVRATVEKETSNATLVHVSREVEKGKTQYEVETTINGKSRDLIVDPSGKLLEVEEEIALEATPAPVQEALKKRGKVLKVESVLRDGTTTYEARVQSRNGKKSSVGLDAQGRPVKG